MIDLIRLQKVSLPILFVVFFIWIQFWIHMWMLFSSSGQAFCNMNGPFGIILPSWLSLFGGVIAIGSILFLRTKRMIPFLEGWPFLFLLSGGLGNILERLSFGCIMDYIAISFFPLFNIADVLLSIGAIGVVWKWWKKNMKNKNKNF